jgi:hypothetical protein
MAKVAKKPTNEGRAAEGPRSRQLTVRINPALVADVRDVVAELSGLPEQMTLARFVADALSRHLAYLRRTISPNLGARGRGHRLRSGRPLKLLR